VQLAAVRLRRALVALALLVLALGLPRLLVRCTEADGSSHVEIALPGRSDCGLAVEHELGAATARLPAAPVPGEERLTAGGCDHESLQVELGLVPQRHPGAAPLSPQAFVATAADAWRPPQQLVRHGLPAVAGPPRTDQRTQLRAIIVLQV
jgi:hypothetical protein